MTPAAFRKTALSFPETAEASHMGHPDFRVRGKIFATVPPDEEHLHIFVDAMETAAAVAHDPQAFEELWWGKKLSGVRVNLAAAEGVRVQELLEESWRSKAPKSLW